MTNVALAAISSFAASPQGILARHGWPVSTVDAGGCQGDNPRPKPMQVYNSMSDRRVRRRELRQTKHPKDIVTTN